jgi:leucyl-tRNA synthetase
MQITEGAEPMVQMRTQGMVLGEDNEKMSKSRGNVTAPDDLVQRYGADAVRSYLIFFAKWDMGAPWNRTGIEGTFRWLKRVWALVTGTAEAKASTRTPLGFFSADSPAKDIADSILTRQEKIQDTERNLRRKVHQTLRQVTHDFEQFEFNTIVSGLMELLNEMYRAKEAGIVGTREWSEAVELYLLMLAPVCPHIAEELWQAIGKPYSIHTQSWPKVDQAATQEDEITIPVQINGKLRERLVFPADADEETIKAAALASETVRKYLEGRAPKKVLVVQKKLVSIVV